WFIDLPGHSAVLLDSAGHRLASVHRDGGAARRCAGDHPTSAHTVGSDWDGDRRVSFLVDVLAWLSAPEHWVGSDGIPNRIGEHLLLSAVTAVVAVLIALPIGVLFGHTGRGGFLAINLANIGRAMPSLALLALMLPVALSLKLGLGFWPTFFALVPLGIPPIL